MAERGAWAQQLLEGAGVTFAALVLPSSQSSGAQKKPNYRGQGPHPRRKPW